VEDRRACVLGPVQSHRALAGLPASVLALTELDGDRILADHPVAIGSVGCSRAKNASSALASLR